MAHPYDAKRTRPYAPGYGLDKGDDTKMLSWAWVQGQMIQSRSYWLCSTRPNGNPHAMPIWAVWHDDALYFGTGVGSVKGKNIAHNPNIVIHLESGDDTVVMEGAVVTETDAALLKTVFAAYAKKYAYNPADDYDVNKPEGWYRFAPSRVLAWLEKDFPNTAVKWEF